MQIKNEILLRTIGVLHNCAKASANRPILQKANFVQAAECFVTTEKTDDNVVLNAILGMSYVFQESQIPKILVPPRTAEVLVTVMNKAVKNTEKHQGDGWHAYELAVGMANLCANTRNKRIFVDGGAVKPLMAMLDFDDSFEKECALGALWKLLGDDTIDMIKADESFLNKLKDLTSNENENVKQAAVRLLTKLSIGQVVRPGSEMCLRCLLIILHFQ